MSDDSDQEYVYSEDEDDYNDDEDAEMSDADAPAAPRARKSGSTGSKDDGAPSRLGDGAYALMEPADVERMMVAKAREVSETLDARPGAPPLPPPPPPLVSNAAPSRRSRPSPPRCSCGTWAGRRSGSWRRSGATASA